MYKCLMCDRPFFFDEKKGMYRVYEVLGKWLCSEGCAMQYLYNDMNSRVVTRFWLTHSQCKEVTLDSDEDRGLTLRDVPPYVSMPYKYTPYWEISLKLVSEEAFEALPQDGRW